MTHDDHWTALQAIHAAKPRRQRQTSKWTKDEILACLASWCAQEGHPPESSRLKRAWQLPDYNTVVLVCGSLEAAWTALGWEYRPWGGRTTPPGRGPMSTTTCLMCGKAFATPDPRCIRVCEKCKSSQEWQSAGEWMGAGAITEAWGGVVDWWEET